MKKNYYIPALILASGIFASCSSELTEDIIPETNIEVSEDSMTRAFPKDDGAKELSGQPAEKLYNILIGSDSAFSARMGNYMPVSKFQYEDIKIFTDELVTGRTTDAQKYRVIYNWVRQNVKYANGEISNEPYDVFINRKAVCQGYANLFYRLALELGVDARIISGKTDGGEGHAWNIVKLDGVYYNLFSALQPGSKFFQLASGDNFFNYIAILKSLCAGCDHRGIAQRGKDLIHAAHAGELHGAVL